MLILSIRKQLGAGKFCAGSSSHLSLRHGVNSCCRESTAAVAMESAAANHSRVAKLPVEENVGSALTVLGSCRETGISSWDMGRFICFTMVVDADNSPTIGNRMVNKG